MQQNMWLIWDIFAVVVLLILVNQCARRGFIRALVSFFGYMAAAFVAKIASTPLAVYLYSNLVRDSLKTIMENAVSGAIGQGQAAAGSLLEAVPHILNGIMGDKEQEIATLFSQNQVVGTTENIAENIIDMMLKATVVSLLEGLCFLLLFSVMLFFVRYFSSLFNWVYRVPIIGPLNTLLGGLLGVVEGVLFLYIGAFVLQLIIAFSSNSSNLINNSIMEQTYIWHMFL